ncbi:MAG: hypothetical protein HYS71_04960 [Candidatus Omnitrophica bacterium]|nr:hypothetical protein [Candidatus Omnitrophota bacterium]
MARSMAMTSDAARRRGSAQPGGLRRQTAISGVAPPRRTAVGWYAIVVAPGSWPSGARNAARAVFRGALLGTAMLIAVIIALWAEQGEAREKSLGELPKDVWDLAFVWTEPIKQAAKEARRFDPVSGTWFGILEGSVKSVERAADFFLPGDEQHPGLQYKSGKALLRYTF